MTIGLTGATGFIGRHFAAAAREAGHDVIGFSRRPDAQTGMRVWQPVQEANFAGLDAVVHLAGENLLGLWTRRKREEIRRSRIDDTRSMIVRLRALPQPPRVIVSAGGCAYYGDGGEVELTEESPPGGGFIAEVAREWEAAAMTAANFTRVVTLRTGMVLGVDGGAAPMLRRIFKCGLGGRLGNGRQWMPWIEVSDMARLILHGVECEALRGPVNAVAPSPVRNADFTRTLAKVLRRPAFLPVPAWVLRRLPGGMSDIFLHSQRAVPAAVMASGFSWRCPEIEAAWQRVLAHRSA
jgi:uncharacterized protein (TIGR01777 family)